LIILTLNKIAPEDLYEDPLVRKWVIAKSKISLARILGFFNYQLVGSVTINYADIKSEGKEELEEMKKKIEGDNASDWFIMFS
jgi:hypothetical protein